MCSCYLCVWTSKINIYIYIYRWPHFCVEPKMLCQCLFILCCVIFIKWVEYPNLWFDDWNVNFENNFCILWFNLDSYMPLIVQWENIPPPPQYLSFINTHNLMSDTSTQMNHRKQLCNVFISDVETMLAKLFQFYGNNYIPGWIYYSQPFYVFSCWLR